MRLQPFSTKENGAVDTATTIKLHFLSLKSSKNRWNLGFQPVHNYGRRLDPNTKAFSAAYNDAVDIANKNRLTFLALEYATNPENMRLQCVFSHFQRRKTGLSILQQQLNSISSLWNLRKIDEIWASSPFIWEIIKTGEAGLGTTIRPQSTLASDIKSIK